MKVVVAKRLDLLSGQMRLSLRFYLSLLFKGIKHKAKRNLSQRRADVHDQALNTISIRCALRTNNY
jgi:hypothetical protein